MEKWDFWGTIKRRLNYFHSNVLYHTFIEILISFLNSDSLHDDFHIFIFCLDQYIIHENTIIMQNKITWYFSFATFWNLFLVIYTQLYSDQDVKLKYFKESCPSFLNPVSKYSIFFKDFLCLKSIHVFLTHFRYFCFSIILSQINEEILFAVKFYFKTIALFCGIYVYLCLLDIDILMEYVTCFKTINNFTLIYKLSNLQWISCSYRIWCDH